MTDLLRDIVDPQEKTFTELSSWIDARLAVIAALQPTPDVIASFVPCELPDAFDGPFGAEESAEWRRFFLGTLLADWVSYERAVDRVDFPRLKYIMSSSSRYFRLWLCRLADGTMAPVGYSAGYPIPQYVFAGAAANSGQIDDRGAFMPQRFVAPENMRHGYIFNVSIVKPLRNTVCSQRMLRAMQRDGKRYPGTDFLAVTVDEAGQRFSRIGGFGKAGEITVSGETEALFVRKTRE